MPSLKPAYPDKECTNLILSMTNTKTDTFWYNNLVRITGKPKKTVRYHLKHLEEAKLIEYIQEKQRRGSKRQFRLTLSGRGERMKHEWCKRLHRLIQEGLFLFTDQSVESQLARLDLGVIRAKSDVGLSGIPPPVKGHLLLEYRTRAYLDDKDPAYRSSKIQDMNLEISWDYLSHKRVNLTVKVRPKQQIS